MKICLAGKIFYWLSKLRCPVTRRRKTKLNCIVLPRSQPHRPFTERTRHENLAKGLKDQRSPEKSLEWSNITPKITKKRVNPFEKDITFPNNVPSFNIVFRNCM